MADARIGGSQTGASQERTWPAAASLGQLAVRSGLIPEEARAALCREVQAGARRGEPVSFARLLVQRGLAPGDRVADVLRSGAALAHVLCDACGRSIPQASLPLRQDYPCPGCGARVVGFRAFAGAAPPAGADESDDDTEPLPIGTPPIPLPGGAPQDAPPAGGGALDVATPRASGVAAVVCATTMGYDVVGDLPSVPSGRPLDAGDGTRRLGGRGPTRNYDRVIPLPPPAPLDDDARPSDTERFFLVLRPPGGAAGGTASAPAARVPRDAGEATQDFAPVLPVPAPAGAGLFPPGEGTAELPAGARAHPLDASAATVQEPPPPGASDARGPGQGLPDAATLALPGPGAGGATPAPGAGGASSNGWHHDFTALEPPPPGARGAAGAAALRTVLEVPSPAGTAFDPTGVTLGPLTPGFDPEGATLSPGFDPTAPTLGPNDLRGLTGSGTLAVPPPAPDAPPAGRGAAPRRRRWPWALLLLLALAAAGVGIAFALGALP